MSKFDRRAPRKPRPEGRGQGELYKKVCFPFREAPPGRAGRLHILEFDIDLNFRLWHLALTPNKPNKLNKLNKPNKPNKLNILWDYSCASSRRFQRLAQGQEIVASSPDP